MRSIVRYALPVLLFVTFGPIAMAQDASAVAQHWLNEQKAPLGLTQKDAMEWEVTSTSTDAKGISYVYVRQTVNGLPVEGAVANFALRDGRVVSFGDRLLRDVSSRVNGSTPALDAMEAVRVAARELGLTASEVHVQNTISRTQLVLSASGISREPIPAQLLYQPLEGGAIRLAWDLTIRSATTSNWWHLAVDANSGELLRNHDYTVACVHPSGNASKGYNAVNDLLVPSAPVAAAMPPPDGSGYRVFALPVESPVYGDRTLVADPADLMASPNGWHDTNDSPGAEYTITRGNNVYAGEDLDNDDLIGYSPDGGSALNFDFAYAPPQSPADYLDAAITNLFYTCNVLHDVWYHYGFDEQSGNFQEFNPSGTGAGNDAVYAQAQDGGGTNNANFGTPPDGSAGAMQMFIWRTSDADTFHVNSPSSIAADYGIVSAGFGPLPPAQPLTEDVVLVQDDTAPESDGCDAILNGAAIAGKIALVDRGQCLFVEKVVALQAQGAVAVVVVNNIGGAPISMGGTDPGTITIPSVMISQADGQIIKDALQNGVVNATLKGAGFASLRDCDFDNGIIAHEYGHGISNRLTGGPSNTDCLYNDEQMGEGWSDWMGMVLSMHPGDVAEASRTVGTFVKDEGPDGAGIRPAPYSTDFGVNPYTYGVTNTFPFQESHALGFVWATMLWDLTWDLIDEVGFDADPYTGTGGNNIAMHLVMDGLKLQPCAPGFVDGRDAILMADELYYGGAYSCVIWNAFARRGLGYGASQGSSFSVNDQVEAFDVPAACSGSGILGPDARNEGFFLVPNPASGLVSVELGSPLSVDSKARILDVDGRLLQEQAFEKGGSTLKMDIQGLAQGVYLVQVEGGGMRVQKRLVVN